MQATSYQLPATIRISAIAIISKNRGLGLDNHLLFHIPGELPRFKALTMGHPIIMGRKTFESIGRVLPGRTNIIVSRNTDFHPEGVVVFESVQKAIEIAQEVEESRIKNQELGKNILNTKYKIQNTESEAFIIGGGQIFQEALPMTDRLYLTVVDKEVDANTFFPDYSAFTKVIKKEEKTDWEIPYTFLTLER